MTFKQEYLHKAGPFPFDFHQERAQMLTRIVAAMRSLHPNEWGMREFQLFDLLSSFKQVYGLTSNELTAIIKELFALLRADDLSCDGSIILTKTLVGLKQYRIEIGADLVIDNHWLLSKLIDLTNNGIPFALKSSDSYMANFIKIIKIYSRYGPENMDRVIQFSLDKRDIKYIALFIKSVKNLASAQKVLGYIFQESGVFERDIPFFYVISELTQQFPQINLAPYYQTLSQEMIKCVTTLIDPSTDDEVRRLTTEDSCIDVYSILKSIAKILVNCLIPVSVPGWEVYWSSVERIFSIISGIIDHSHEVQSVDDFLIFMKEFVKAFIGRERKQRGLFKQVNEDFVEEFTDRPASNFVITDRYLEMFWQIWEPLIPELLYLEDSDVKSAKILSDLSLFMPQKYLGCVLREIKSYLSKDLTIVSLHTPKMTVLFLQEFIISNYADQPEFTMLIQICESFLDAIEKLGISENLDMLELVMRSYMYFSEKSVEEVPLIQTLTEDIISVIENNMDPMSINLESTESEEAELYTDFRNIYFNFLIRLTQQQAHNLSDKILYKIMTSVPPHRQAYEFIVVGLCYVYPSFSLRILDGIYKQMVVCRPQGTNQAEQKTQMMKIAEQALPYHLEYSLATENEEHLRWYSSMLQCAFQYHPDNVVQSWQKLEIIIALMLRQFDKPNVFDWGQDIIFNLVINLEHVHLDHREFFAQRNRKYQTLAGIKWKRSSAESIQILKIVKEKFYDRITQFFKERYSEALKQSPIANKLTSRKEIPHRLNKYGLFVQKDDIATKQFCHTLIDCLLAPAIPSPEDIEEKKYLSKLLSIQYSIFSALQMRAKFADTHELQPISGIFIAELGCMRLEAIPYLKWIMAVLGHFNSLYDPNLLKVFHYFWREAHDQLYFSSGIQATATKLSPFFYPVSFKKKQIFENSFLIITQCYLAFMMRIQLFNNILSLAYVNDEQFLDYYCCFSLINSLECNLNSYVPSSIPVHDNLNYKINMLCRQKLSITNQESYISKFLANSKDSNDSVSQLEKEKYLGATRVIISTYKRLNIFSHPSCMGDMSFWLGLVDLLKVSTLLEKKADQIAIIELIYLLIVFSFDFRGKYVYSVDMGKVDRGEATLGEQDLKMMQNVLAFIELLLSRLQEELTKKYYGKDATVTLLLIISFSEFVPINNKLFSRIIPLTFEILSKGNLDMMNMSKSYVFRIMNRFIRKKVIIERRKNEPLKRQFEQFLVFRHIGGEVDSETLRPVNSLDWNKTDNYYYPAEYLEYVHKHALQSRDPNEEILRQILSNQEALCSYFKCLSADTELKNQQSEVDLSYLSEEEPKRIYSNGHKLINYILDCNPRKLDIFVSFIDNFSNYPICFYHRLFRKMMELGGAPTIQILKTVARRFIASPDKEQVKLCHYLIAEILAFSLQDQDYVTFYADYLLSSSKQQFEVINGALLVVFCNNWNVSQRIFNQIIQRLRADRGPSRLRHLQILNNYITCMGRFSRDQAKKGIFYLLKGIQEGSDEVSQLIVSMLVYCFLLPINLTILQEWTIENPSDLIQSLKLYRLDDKTAYEFDKSVTMILADIMQRAANEKDIQSKNLKTYSKIAYKILSTITVYRFNDQFYRLFKPIILYIINKPIDEEGIDAQIVSQLMNSEYPAEIYTDLMKQLVSMEGNTINVLKKKLKYIEGIVINKIFTSNIVHIPDFISALSEKQITIDHIIALSNMMRALKAQQLFAEVQKQLQKKQNSLQNLCFMMACLLAAGTRDFQWREKILSRILAYKKNKIVKQFVSYWWKGRNPETQKEQTLCMLVRSVENPYSYFA